MSSSTSESTTYAPTLVADGSTPLGTPLNWVPNKGPGLNLYRWDNTDGKTPSEYLYAFATNPRNIASMIWDEALAENARRDAMLPTVHLSPEDAAFITSPSTITAEARTAAGKALATMRRREADMQRDLADARRQVSDLQGEISDPMDERIRGIWVAAARHATEEGHCPEYDRLASDIGAPDRDWLRERGYLDRPGTVSVVVEYRVNIAVSDIDNYEDEVDEMSIDSAVSDDSPYNWYVSGTTAD